MGAAAAGARIAAETAVGETAATTGLAAATWAASVARDDMHVVLGVVTAAGAERAAREKEAATAGTGEAIRAGVGL